MSAPKLYRYYLDGRPFEEPLSWEKWEEQTERDKELNALLTTISVTVEFYGAAYDYLYRTKLNSGKDGRNFLQVDEYNGSGYTTVYKGTIFSAGVEFNRTKRIAKAQVEDDSYNARINNNRNVPAVISSGRTKNGVAFDPPEAYMVELRKVADNTSLGRSVYCVRLYELFRCLIAFMSDNEVDFHSDAMDTGALSGFCITKGIKLFSLDTDVNGSAETDPMPEITFVDAYQNVTRKYPLGIAIERIGGRARIRIEPAEWFYSENTIHRFKNTPELVETMDQSRLYAKILFGSDEVNFDSSFPFPEDITFFGFKQEEIPVAGIGNIDTALDLRTSWIVSSNVIQLLTEDPNNEYDSEFDSNVVLLETVKTDNFTGYTLNQNYLELSPAKYFFNKAFTNDQVASRWIDSAGIPDSILKFIFPDTLGYLFKAKLSADQSYATSGNDVFNPAGFDQELFDERGAYNNGIFRYTAAKGGLFTFRANARINITGQSGSPAIVWRIVIRHYDSDGFEKSDVNNNGYNLYYPNYTGTGGIEYISAATIGTFDLGGKPKTLNMAKDDYCEIYIEKAIAGAGDIDYTIEEENTYFECISAVVSGDYEKSGDPIMYKATIAKFEDSIRPHQYRAIMDNQDGKIYVDDAYGNKNEGYIEQMTYNRLTTEIKATIVSSQPTP